MRREFCLPNWAKSRGLRIVLAYARCIQTHTDNDRLRPIPNIVQPHERRQLSLRFGKKIRGFQVPVHSRQISKLSRWSLDQELADYVRQSRSRLFGRERCVFAFSSSYSICLIFAWWTVILLRRISRFGQSIVEQLRYIVQVGQLSLETVQVLRSILRPVSCTLCFVHV